MVETLEHLIRKSSLHPRFPRGPLYKELLRSETFLLTVDAPIKETQVSRVAHAAESFPIWADKDAELGGTWVPVFPSRDSVSTYVSARDLDAPSGKEFLWMGHKPGAVFGLLQGVHCFAGIRLWLDEAASLGVPWSDVRALSEGKLPHEYPERYELPVARLSLPGGTKLAFGKVDAGPGEGPARLLCLPEAGHFATEDTRKLVRLDLGQDGKAWMACRHFLQVLRFVRKTEDAASGRYLEDLLCSLVGFEMFGEAEALCEWMAKKGDESYAWAALAAIYGKTGRLAECAKLCHRAAAKYPAEVAFPLGEARALARLGRRKEAALLLRAAIRRFPDDARLSRALGELG